MIFQALLTSLTSERKAGWLPAPPSALSSCTAALTCGPRHAHAAEVYKGLATHQRPSALIPAPTSSIYQPPTAACTRARSHVKRFSPKSSHLGEVHVHRHAAAASPALLLARAACGRRAVKAQRAKHAVSQTSTAAAAARRPLVAVGESQSRAVRFKGCERCAGSLAQEAGRRSGAHRARGRGRLICPPDCVGEALNQTARAHRS